MDSLFACEIGTRLWLEHRAANPEAPIVPPEGAEEWPDATAYWEHAAACDDCNEV